MYRSLVSTIYGPLYQCVSIPSWYAVLVEHIGDCLHSEALQVD